MSPTDEERRAVAARLRAKHRERTRPCMFVPQDVEIQAWDYLLDLEECLPDGDSAFTVLADLIEPEPERTCRMRYDPVHCDYVCTACGEWHNTAMYDACDADDMLVFKPYKFCPKCGARVEGCE